MNCNLLTFSQKLSQQRIHQAETLLGEKVVKKILGYALYLQGADRTSISDAIKMPPGTLRSIIHGINNRGLTAFEDQRSKVSTFRPPPHHQIKPCLQITDSFVKVDFGIKDLELNISNSNPVQKRVILLTLLNSRLLKRSQISKALNLSDDRAGKLARKLQQHDVESILDKRRGQQRDYLFTPEIKGEVIQQFILDIVEQGHTSGEQLSKNLAKRRQLDLSPRSILHHLSELGLTKIKTSLLENLTSSKKNL